MGADTPAPRIYPSKRDRWIVWVLWICVLVLLFVAAHGLVRSGFRTSMLIVAAVCLLSVWTTLATLYGTSYVLSSDRLLVRSWLFRWRVDLSAITEVSPTRSSLSGPALSLDRLQIKYRGSSGGLQISPVDKRGFLEDLVARAPYLELEGDRAVQRGPGLDPPAGT
ncbi:MAG: PH domain-containing protein [Candidatus Latescibacteria bacterium]|jgi:hypothetical protein|nr:PH domain-containing protein [Candidatus Latescibacterota bacterium]